MRKKRLNSTLYFIHKWKKGGGYREMISSEDGSLFSDVFPTKIFPEDLPEWYIYGRYYKRFGYISTKGVVDLVYVPGKFTNHFLKDDFLYISYKEKITKIEPEDKWSYEKYNGYDHMIYGSEILDFLIGARDYSGYDISALVEQLREKKRWLQATYPDEFGPGKWDFDIDKWLTKPIYRPESWYKRKTKEDEDL